LSDYSAVVQYRQGGFHKSDMTITYAPPARNWQAQVYVRNIEDKTVMTSYYATGASSVGLGAPRTAGLRLAADF
jgi:iron complex outermembrane receptor protein